jgi:hypothetical protein
MWLNLESLSKNFNDLTTTTVEILQIPVKFTWLRKERQNSIFNGLQVSCIPPQILLLTLILYITTAGIFMRFINKKVFVGNWWRFKTCLCPWFCNSMLIEVYDFIIQVEIKFFCISPIIYWNLLKKWLRSNLQ